MQTLKPYNWYYISLILPFFFFILGYIAIRYYYNPPESATPHIIGMTLYNAARLLFKHNLSLKIVSEKVDSHLPPSTVLWQTPYAGQKIKGLQNVLCVMSVHPPVEPIPNFIGLSLEQIKERAEKKSIKIKYHYIPTHRAIENTCVGQYPSNNSNLTDLEVQAYIASVNHPYIIIPSFQEKTVASVKDICVEFSPIINLIVLPKVLHTCSECIVKEQKPTAGSMVYAPELKKIELYVEHRTL